MTTKILIDVQGGLVQGVLSTDNVEVTLIDWDNIKEGCETEFIIPDNYGYYPMTEQELQRRIDEANLVVTDNIAFISDDNSGSPIHIVTEEQQNINYQIKYYFH